MKEMGYSYLVTSCCLNLSDSEEGKKKKEFFKTVWKDNFAEQR